MAYIYPEYTDTSAWSDLISQYEKKQNYIYLIPDAKDKIWDYFKYCLRSNNRYFFNHPMLELLERTFKNHVVTLDDSVNVYRARVDSDGVLCDEWMQYSSIGYTQGILQNMEKRGVDKDLLHNLSKKLNVYKNSPEIQSIVERLQSGFQGFDAMGSSAPPSDKASPGRCNLQGVSYLYTALDEHTAVAEIRPHFQDIISIAELKPVRPLRLVSFYYDPEAIVYGENSLFNCIQREYARQNRDKTGNYTVTQYITAFIEHLGYDGLCFRSSLVKEGTNYVIFNSQDCTVLSSKLCYLSEVTYNFGQFKQ